MNLENIDKLVAELEAIRADEVADALAWLETLVVAQCVQEGK